MSDETKTQAGESYFYLCCRCGYVTEASAWLCLNANPAYDSESAPWEPELILADDDPSVVRCPACKYDHRDDDSGPGMFDGTRERVLAERDALEAGGHEWEPDVVSSGGNDR